MTNIITRFFSLMLFIIIVLALGAGGVTIIIVLGTIGNNLLGIIGAVLFGIFALTLAVFLIYEIVMWIADMGGWDW